MTPANCGVGNRVNVPLREIEAVFHFAPSQRDVLFMLRTDELARLVELTRGRLRLEDARLPGRSHRTWRGSLGTSRCRRSSTSSCLCNAGSTRRPAA